MNALPVVRGFAVVWLLIAMMPMPRPSARKAWGRGVLGVSVLLVLLAAFLRCHRR